MPRHTGASGTQPVRHPTSPRRLSLTRPGWTATAGFLVLVAAVAFASSARAARLPTKAEGKALLAAFRHDQRHPRKAEIALIRVSTASRQWARVQWVLPPAHRSSATAARVKIINFSDYNFSHHGKSAHPAKRKPPKGVRNDFKNDFFIDFDSRGVGSEDGTKTTTFPPAPGGECSETDTIQVHQQFSWTEKFRIDLSTPADFFDGAGDEPEGEIWFMEARKPFLGENDLTATARTTYSPESCDPPTTVTCTEKMKTRPRSYALQLIDSLPLGGLYSFGGYWATNTSSCSDGGTIGNRGFLSRYLGGAGLVVHADLCCGGDLTDAPGTHHLSFPADAARHTDPGPAHSQHLGLCPKNWASSDVTSCSDDVSEKATVTITLPPSDSP